MNLWLDGLSALAGHAWAVVAILLIILWGFLITRGFLIRFFGDALTEADLLSISVSGWFMPALFLSIVTFGISLLFNALMRGIFLVVIILISSFALIRKKLVLSHILVLMAFLTPSLILRFAFVTNMVLPSYFDSAEHYRLIDALTETYNSGIFFDSFQGMFYHLGFHLLAAFISHFMRVDILDLLLVFGQIILAVLSISFFFVVKHETDSTLAACFVCLLAGFGFHMPAHLMNWGKYPALLGLPAMLFVFNLAYMASCRDTFKDRKHIFILLGGAILASTLIHSRTLILFGLMFTTAIITFYWSHLLKPHRILGFVILVTLFAVEIYIIHNNPTLKTLLDGYIKNDLWVLALIFLLTIFAAACYLKWTFFLLTWLTLCGLGLFIPITLPIHGIQALLDRPFVQMFTYIPLSFLGGLGFAGVMQISRRLFPDLKLIQRSMPFTLFGFILLNIAWNYDFYPSDCCRFATRDDIAAFTWLDENAPADTNILIASTGLYVTSFESPQTLTGVDAGIWIPPLLSRNVKLARKGVQFNLTDVHKDFCEQGIDYIYVGGMPESFNSLHLDNQPNWYVPVFTLPSAKVYQINCEP